MNGKITREVFAKATWCTRGVGVNIIDQIHNLMKTKSIVILLVIIVVVVGIVLYCLLLEKPPVSEVPGPGEIPPPEDVIPPAATGNVDDIVDALMKELSDEESVLTEEEGDAALVTSDSQEIADFGQSVDEDDL